MNAKKGRGMKKRFLAGFLALLMATALPPTNTCSVAYAEEPDAVEAKGSDVIAVAEEESQAVDSNAVIDENIPHVNEEESLEDAETETVSASNEESMTPAEEETTGDPLYDGEGGSDDADTNKNIDTEDEAFAAGTAVEAEPTEAAAEADTASSEGTAGFTEEGGPVLSISGEGNKSLDCPKPGDVLRVNYTLDKTGSDISTIKWYKTGNDGKKSEIIAAEHAVTPIARRVCWCGYIMDIYTYGLSAEESAAWSEHAHQHSVNGEISNYSTPGYKENEAVTAAHKKLTVTDDLIGCTITVEVTPETTGASGGKGTPVETKPTGVVTVAGSVSVYNLEFIAGDIPVGTYDHTVTKTGFTVKAGADPGKTVTVDTSRKTIDGYAYTARLKMDGVGTKDYRSIQFSTGKANATLKIVCASASDDNPSSLGIGVIAGGGTGTMTEFTGKYKLHGGAEKSYQSGGIRIDNRSGIGDAKADIVEAALAADTTYCLYTAGGSGINFYAVYVTYQGGVSANYYTITFDTDGGTAAAPQRALEGERYLEPSTTKTGYTLNGWYPSLTHARAGDVAYQFNFNVTKASRNLTIYAGWKEDSTETGDPYELDMAELLATTYYSTFQRKAFTFAASSSEYLSVGSNGGRVTSVTDDDGVSHTYTQYLDLNGKGTVGSDASDGTRNISFTIEKKATLTVVVESGNVGTYGQDRTLVVANDKGDSYRITAPKTGAIMTNLNTKLTPAKWYIYSSDKNIKVYYIRVSFGSVDVGGGEGGEDDHGIAFIEKPRLSIALGTSGEGNPSLTTPREGNVLTVDYTLDLDEDAFDMSTITWYRTSEGTADRIIKTGSIYDDDMERYTVTGDDAGYRIKVEVTPEDSAGNTGAAESAETGTVREAGEENLIFTTAPALRSTGRVYAPKPDDVLTVSYGLTVGEGEEDHSTIRWYCGKNELTAASGSKSYTVTEADIGKAISVEVTPYISETKYGDTVTLTTGTVISKQQEDAPPTGSGLRIVFNDGDVYTYTGSAIKPSVTVWNDNKKLVEGTDYTVKYSNNTKASRYVDDRGVMVDITGNSKRWPTVTVTGKGNLGGKTSETFRINPKNLQDAKDDWRAANAGSLAGVKLNDAVVLPGKKATPVLLYGGMKLTAKDYTVTAVTGSRNDTIAKPANATWDPWTEGTMTLTAKSKGNYTGEAAIGVIVVDATMQKAAKIKAAFTDGSSAKTQYYNAKSITPSITVKNSDREYPMASDETNAHRQLEKDVDYVISYPADTTNVGTKKVTITGISVNCVGTVTLSYSIKPAKKTDASLEAVLTPDAADEDGYDFVSTGVTVSDDLKVYYQYNGDIVDTPLTEGVDYKVTYSNNKKAGFYTAAYVVTGLGNYKGLKTAKQYFTIKGIVLSNRYKSETAGEGIQLIVGDKIYTKKAVYKSVPSLIVNGELVKASEYSVSYRLDETDSWSTKLGKMELGEEEPFKTIYVKITPKPNKVNYIADEDGGELTASYHVVRETKKNLSGAKITILGENNKAAKVAYTGNKVKPYKAVIKIKGLDNTEIILDGEDADYEKQGFKVTYANNTLKGKATVVIEATEDNYKYVGSKTAAFSIVQKNFKAASFIKSLLGNL